MAKTIITPDEVAKIGKLANLNLTDTEIEKFSSQLAGIFGYINQLSQVDTDKISPTAHVNNLTHVVRVDALDKQRTLSQKETIGQSRKIEKNMFVVKAVIDNDS